MKRTVSVMAAIFFLLIPSIALNVGAPDAYSPTRSVLDGGLLGEADAYIAGRISSNDVLDELNLAIRVLDGQREYDQIFISGDELIPDLDPPMDYQVRDNTEAILRFAEQVGAPTYCMIIPTVSAIRQQSLPSFFLGQSVNQKQFIEDVYSSMLGRVTTIDAYTTLFNAREQYIYYRTENNLTSLGGFYLYSALGGKLLEGIARPTLQDYDIEYVKYDYYGDLYARSPFKEARADTLSIFRYTRTPREYAVAKRGNGVTKTYHTIYPLHAAQLDEGGGMDIYLGGLSAITTVTTSSPYSNNLLVLGDKTALTYVPFLANHYRTITLVDLFQLDRADFDLITGPIRENAYDQVLFAYSVETYMYRPYPAWTVRLLPAPDDALGAEE